MKKYTIFAGVNGAGKSTFYHQYYKPSNQEKRINTDEMVARVGTWRDDNLQLRCGKEAVKLIKEYFSKGYSFNQETTLTGKAIFKNIQRAKRLGYEVHLYYVGLENVEIALERIEKRVNQGGHGIEHQAVIRRYNQSFENLNEVFQYCDKISLFDNSNAMNLVAKFKNGNLVFKSKSIPNWLKKNDILDNLYNFYF